MRQDRLGPAGQHANFRRSDRKKKSKVRVNIGVPLHCWRQFYAEHNFSSRLVSKWLLILMLAMQQQHNLHITPLNKDRADDLITIGPERLRPLTLTLFKSREMIDSYTFHSHPCNSPVNVFCFVFFFLALVSD